MYVNIIRSSIIRHLILPKRTNLVHKFKMYIVDISYLIKNRLYCVEFHPAHQTNVLLNVLLYFDFPIDFFYAKCDTFSLFQYAIQQLLSTSVLQYYHSPYFDGQFFRFIQEIISKLEYFQYIFKTSSYDLKSYLN